MALDLILQLVQGILSRFTHGTLMKMEHSHTLILAEVACGAVKNLDVQDQACESSASGQYLTAHNGIPARSLQRSLELHHLAQARQWVCVGGRMGARTCSSLCVQEIKLTNHDPRGQYLTQHTTPF